MNLHSKQSNQMTVLDIAISCGNGLRVTLLHTERFNSRLSGWVTDNIALLSGEIHNVKKLLHRVETSVAKVGFKMKKVHELQPRVWN